MFALRFQKIHEEPNLFAFLVASLCPSIYGNNLVKAGIFFFFKFYCFLLFIYKHYVLSDLLGLLLGLFGGNNSQVFAAKSPFSKRSDIHVLIVGDPGLGKSQMLHACSMVSPRGIHMFFK